MPANSERVSGATKRPPGRNGFTYKQQYGIIVRCGDEADQARIYEKLKSEGYQLKVVCV